MLNHVVLIVMDSCRYDSCVAAHTPNIDRIGTIERRFSYASWTSPSHCVLLMGLMPHASPRGVLASEIYKSEFADWVARVGDDALSFDTFVPYLSLPRVLGDIGYTTVGRVSMPVLNECTTFSSNFDDYQLMEDHNDFAGMVDEAEFPADQPMFYFFNLGETHYPYMLKDMPRISGLHGVFKRETRRSRESTETSPSEEGFTCDEPQMRRLQAQQIACVEYIDGLIGRLIHKAPANTHFVVTADHGELFGEDGYFGHGPIMHPKCFEVPFAEGVKPRV